METLRCRTRLAVLCIFKAFISIGFLFLSFLEPGTIQGLMAGKVFGMELTEGAVIFYGISAFWVPLIMAWAAMTLKISINRWVSIIVGLFGATVLTIGIFQNKDPLALLINSIIAVALHLMIAWYGWKLPEEET